MERLNNNAVTSSHMSNLPQVSNKALIAQPILWVFLTWISLSLITVLVSLVGWKFPTAGIIIAIVGMLAGIFLVSFGRPRIHPLSIISLISVSHASLFIFRPYYAAVFQSSKNIFTKQEYDSSYILAQIIAAVGFVCLCLGYRVIPGKQNAAITQRTTVPVPPSQWPAYAVLLWITVGMGFGLYGIYVLQVGPSNWWTSISGGRSEASRQAIEGFSAYLYSGNQFAFGALIFLALHFGASRNRSMLTLVGVLLLASSYPAFASGSRSVFIPLFIALLYVTYVVHPAVLKLRHIALWGPLAYVFLFIAPRLWREGSAKQESLSLTLRNAFSFESAVGEFFGGLDTAMVDAFAVQIAAQNSGALEHTYGISYLSLLLGIVPRNLWPGKPVPVDSYLNSELFPRTYAQGTGFSFSVYSEPYLALGVAGVALACFFMGLLCARIAGRCLSVPRLDYAFAIVLVTSYIFPVFRGSVSFDIQRLLMPLIPVLLVVLVCKIYYGRSPSTQISHIN